MAIINVKNCPVCGNSGRKESANGIASIRRNTGRHYLKFAAKQAKLTVDQLLDAVRVYQCDICRSYYCDPWISARTASYIFTDGAPDHMAGWENFEHWLSSGRLNSVDIANTRLYPILLEKIGPVASYAEYGCPFQGFLLLFKRLETTPDQRIELFSNAMKRTPDTRWTKSPRIYHISQRLAHLLTVGYHRIRAVKERGREGGPTQAPTEKICPQRRVLLTDEATKHWGNNCVRYGFSCKYFAHRMLDAEVLPLNELVDDPDTNNVSALDLLGIFNILDHTNSPAVVLNKGLRLARHIVVATHHAALAGKQHLFAFDESFPAWLASQLKNATVEDISEQMLENGKRIYNYILISRNSPG